MDISEGGAKGVGRLIKVGAAALPPMCGLDNFTCCDVYAACWPTPQGISFWAARATSVL